MADTKISGLPASTTPLAGTEIIPVVQSGVTKKVSVADLTSGRAISATQVTLTTGNLVIGTSGKGIDFSADGQAAGMTSELLNDYEEGTWTASVRGLGTAGTYEIATNDCRYTKIGRIVNVSARIVMAAAVTGGGTSGVQVVGLPFNYPAQSTANGGVTGSAVLTGIAFTGSYTTLGRVSSGASNNVYFIGMDNAGTGTTVPVANVGPNDVIEFNFSYTV